MENQTIRKKKREKEKKRNRLDLLIREKLGFLWEATPAGIENILQHSGCIHFHIQGFILITLEGDTHHSHLMRKYDNHSLIFPY